MKTWGRGKKRLTEKEKEASIKWQHERVKIANLIARKPEIKKICCICGKEGKILHNRENPYYITFICDECKKDSENINKAEKTRFDVREKLDKANLCVSNFSDTEINQLVNGYINNQESIEKYCEKNNISRHQFNQIIDRYKKLFPPKDISTEVKEYFKLTQRKIINKKIENIKAKPFENIKLTEGEVKEIVEKVKNLIHDNLKYSYKIPKERKLLLENTKENKELSRNEQIDKQIFITESKCRLYCNYLSNKDKEQKNLLQTIFRMLDIISDNTPNAEYIATIFRPCVTFLKKTSKKQYLKMRKLEESYYQNFKREYDKLCNLKYGAEIVDTYGDLAITNVPKIEEKYIKLKEKITKNDLQYLELTEEKIDYLCSDVDDNITDYFKHLHHKPEDMFAIFINYHLYNSESINVCEIYELMNAFRSIVDLIVNKYEKIIKDKEPKIYYIKDNNNNLGWKYHKLYFSNIEQIEIKEICELLEEYDQIKLKIKKEIEKLSADMEFLISEFNMMDIPTEGINGYDLNKIDIFQDLFKLVLAKEVVLEDYIRWIFCIDGAEEPKYDFSVGSNFLWQ